MDRRVFLLARAGTPLELVHSVLRDAGLNPVSVETSEATGSISEAVEDGLKNAAFVMLVVDNRALPRSVIFEAGLAKGLGKSVVVLDARTRGRSMSDELPIDVLLDAPRMFARLNDKSALSQELDAYLASREDTRPAKVRGPYRAAPSWESEADERTFEALQRAGARLVSVRKSPHGVPDLSIDLAQLGTGFNPVFVEVAGLRAAIDRKTAQMAEALRRSSVRLGLLITLDPEPSFEEGEDLHRVDFGQAVVIRSLKQLEGDPDAVVRDLVSARNRLVHGR